MARSTGPVLAIGGITMANQVVFQNQPVNWRVPIATGITAGMLALLERLNEGLAVGLAWLALITLLVTRIDPKTKSPMESLLEWWNKP
jgi:hypothetical protein